MKRYYAVIGIAVAMVLCLTAVSFAGNGYERFFGSDSSGKIPTGWSNGEKKGWDGNKLPPGLSKKALQVEVVGPIEIPDDVEPLPNIEVVGPVEIEMPDDLEPLPNIEVVGPVEIEAPDDLEPLPDTDEPVIEGQEAEAVIGDKDLIILPYPFPGFSRDFMIFLKENGVNPWSAYFGDWDGDGEVTQKDTAALNKLYSKVLKAIKNGDLKPEDVAKDLNGDGKVDKHDIDLQFKNFRQKIKDNIGRRVPIIIIRPIGPIPLPMPKPIEEPLTTDN